MNYRVSKIEAASRSARAGAGETQKQRAAEAALRKIASRDELSASRTGSWAAFLWPYFLRSTTRKSRVRKPSFLSGPRDRLVGDQRLGEAVAHRAGLARKAAARDRHGEVILADAVGHDERLMKNHAQHGAREIDLHRLAVDETLPQPGLIQTRATAFLRLPVA